MQGLSVAVPEIAWMSVDDAHVGNAVVSCASSNLEAAEVWGRERGRDGELLSYVDGAELACGPIVDSDKSARVDASELHGAIEGFEMDRETLVEGVAGTYHCEDAGFVFGVRKELELDSETNRSGAYRECGKDIFALDPAAVLEFFGRAGKETAIDGLVCCQCTPSKHRVIVCGL